MVAIGRYILPTQEMRREKSFNTANKIVNVGSDLDTVYGSFVEEMKIQAADFQEKDSGWTLEKILYLEVNIKEFLPLGGSSYIRLSKFIESRKEEKERREIGLSM